MGSSMHRFINALPTLFIMGLIFTLSLFLSTETEEVKLAVNLSPLMALGVALSVFAKGHFNRWADAPSQDSIMLEQAWERRRARASDRHYGF